MQYVTLTVWRSNKTIGLPSGCTSSRCAFLCEPQLTHCICSHSFAEDSYWTFGRGWCIEIVRSKVLNHIDLWRFMVHIWRIDAPSLNISPFNFENSLHDVKSDWHAHILICQSMQTTFLVLDRVVCIDAAYCYRCRDVACSVVCVSVPKARSIPATMSNQRSTLSKQHSTF